MSKERIFTPDEIDKTRIEKYYEVYNRLAQNFAKTGLTFTGEIVGEISNAISLTSFTSRELHPLYFPEHYKDDTRPEIINESELQAIRNEKYVQSHKLRANLNIMKNEVSAKFPESVGKEFTKILDSATTDHIEETSLKCAIYLSDESYNMLTASRALPPKQYNILESALLFKDNPEFKIQFENKLHIASREEVGFLKQHRKKCLSKEGRRMLTVHLARSYNKESEKYRKIMAALPKEDKIRVDESRNMERTFATILTARPTQEGKPQRFYREGADFDFEKPDSSKEPIKPALAGTPVGYYDEKISRIHNEIKTALLKESLLAKAASGGSPVRDEHASIAASSSYAAPASKKRSRPF